MARETIEAKTQIKDSEGNAVMEEVDGKNVISYRKTSAEFDFGDDLDAAVELCGKETVHSNYRANAKVALQGVLRALLGQGLGAEAIQAKVDGWKPGMVMAGERVDPETAIENAFKDWPEEKQKAFLAKLGLEI